MSDTRVALVTGANKGIGFEVCRQLAAEGVHVILTARDEAKGRRARDQLAAEGGTVTFFPLDVTDTKSVRVLRAFVEHELHRLDFLVNNAGVALDKFVPALELDVEILRETIETNVLGCFRVSQALAPLMTRTGGGRIVMLSSMLASLERMGGLTLAYRLSKTAVNAIVRVLAAELRDSGVLVNAVCPGWVRTDLGGAEATTSVEDGARSVVSLLFLPEDGPTGAFFREGVRHPW